MALTLRENPLVAEVSRTEPQALSVSSVKGLFLSSGEPAPHHTALPTTSLLDSGL